MYKDAVYSSGFVSIKQQELLNLDRAERMLNAQNITEALQVLLDCGYDQAVLEKTPIDIDVLLDVELEKTVEFFEEFCTDNNLKIACLLRYDYHNAKVFAKAKYFGATEKRAVYSVGLLGNENLRQAINQAQYDELPSQMAYALTAIDELAQSSKLSSREIDIILDKAAFEQASGLTKKIRSKKIGEYLVANADICNIMTVFRSKRAGLIWEQTQSQLVGGGNISSEALKILFDGSIVELTSEFADSEYFDIIKRMQSQENIDTSEDDFFERLLFLIREDTIKAFSDEPLFAWYIQKLAEIKTVRLIFVCKTNNLSDQIIVKRLKMIYG